MIILKYKGYFRSPNLGAKIEDMSPRFFRIRKRIMGMIMVKINIGRMLPLCSCREFSLGVTKK
jgi:hypothetical protein